MVKPHVFRFFLLAVLTSTLAACGGSGASTANTTTDADEPIYTRVSDATLSAGDDIPVPEGDIILTVTGNIGTTNVDESVQFDMATLESLGEVEYEVTDPFSQEDVVYRGVLMSDFLAVLQVPEDATALGLTALDDYSIDIPLEELTERPVILALRADGEYITIENRGPSRVIFPYGYFDYDPDIVNSYWIWQIVDVEVQ